MKTFVGYCVCLFGWLSFVLELPDLAEKPRKWASIAGWINERLVQAGRLLADSLPPIPLDLLKEGYWNSFRFFLYWPQLLNVALIFVVTAVFGVGVMLLSPPSHLERLVRGKTNQLPLFNAFMISGVFLEIIFPKLFVYRATNPAGVPLSSYAFEAFGASLARSSDPNLLFHTSNVYLLGALLAFNALWLVALAAWRRATQKHQREVALHELLKTRHAEVKPRD